MRPALFLDRDGTLVHSRHYPSQPHQLILYDDLAPGLHRFQSAGYALVVITNQAGLARGYFDEDDLARMHEHLLRELGRLAVQLDGIYHCPHHPAGTVPQWAVACSCRKPQPGMLLRAAAELELDLGRSWFVGDILDDVEAGNRAGCRTALVDLGTETPSANPLRQPTLIAPRTRQVLDQIADSLGLGMPLTIEPALTVGQPAAVYRAARTA